MKSASLLKVVRYLMPRLTRVEIEGRQHVPQSGPVIMVVNHLGLLDAPLGFYAADRADATGWVADKHQSNPLYTFLINTVDGVWINREETDMRALRGALRVLDEGRLFGVAPEGTRSPTGAMIPGKPGAAYLALSANVPILPGGLTGTETGLSEWRRLQRPQLRLRFGPTFRLPRLDRQRRQQQMEAGIDEIMCRIAALIPPEYRGVYADHPRLQELLDGAP